MGPARSVLAFTDHLQPSEIVAYARRVESLGYEAMLLPDLLGRDLFVLSGYILADTDRLRVGTGIAGIYGRDALAMAQHGRTLDELHEGRFILGLGVSNPMGAQMRGQTWGPPLRKMREYLEAMSKGEVAKPARKPPVYLAAHGPKMLALAATHADGANTYLMPPSHTRVARSILGPEKDPNVFLPCCLCEDPVEARRTARKGIAAYFGIDAYLEQWKRLGFSSDDLREGGSDSLVDSLVAWGDVDAIQARIEAHLEAGARHVVVLPYNPIPRGRTPSWPVLEALAPSGGCRGMGRPT